MTLDPTEVPSLLTKMAVHFFDMHWWQKSLLAVALLLFGTGTTHQITSYFGQSPTTMSSDGSSVSQNQQPEPTIGQKISPWAMRVGASFILGFILGFALRIFVRITATVLIVGAIILMLLSRFHIMNVDFTKAQVEYQSSIHWLQDQAQRLKDLAVAHLPHSGSGVVGAFAGFRRRRLTV